METRGFGVGKRTNLHVKEFTALDGVVCIGLLVVTVGFGVLKLKGVLA